MQTRRLGRTDLELTEIGLGTWAIGGSESWQFGWGAQDDDEAVAAIAHGIDAGINWIDTAAVYGAGHAEESVGRALRELGPSRRPIVATKCSRIVQPDGTVEGCLEHDSLIAECEASLRRLGVETIDLYQMHWPKPDPEIERGWETLALLREQGKVRWIGVSNFAAPQMQRLQPIHEIASLQPPYSMLRREVEAEALPYCAAEQIGVVAYSPMGKGLLTGAFSPERAAALASDDHRSRDPDFAAPRLGANLALVDGLRDIARRCDLSIAQLSIAWVLRRPEVTSAIVGVRRPEQVDDLLTETPLSLDDDVQAEINALIDTRDCAVEAT